MAQIMPGAHATLPLSTLLRQYHLGLVLIAGGTAPVGSGAPDDPEPHLSATPARIGSGGSPAPVAEDPLNAPVQWVHGSDLADPSPFLTPRTVLLTTGAQFRGEDAPPTRALDAALLEAVADPSTEVVDAYVARLVSAGVCALGFGVGIVYERIPESLIAACDAHALPLFRVPYLTPFIAIVQSVARLIERETHARDAWSVQAQRGIALAALHSDGLGAAVRELSSRLGRWVAIYDGIGRITQISPATARSTASADWVRAEVSALIERGNRASRVLSGAHDGAQLQTLGSGGHLRGVFAVGGQEPLDAAAQAAIGTVVALATVTLDHSGKLATANSALRSGVLTLLEGGHVDLATAVAGEAWGRLPRTPLRVLALGAGPHRPAALTAQVRSLSEALGSSVFSGNIDGQLFLLAEQRLRRPIIDALTAGGFSSGSSLPTDYAHLSQGFEQARRALDAAEYAGGGQQIEFDLSHQAGLLELIEGQDAAVRRAASLLGPLVLQDERADEHLIDTLETWLRHHGQFSPAAEELGLHRHTLRTRIQRIAGLLQRDLNLVDTRAELWAALRVHAATAPPEHGALP